MGGSGGGSYKPRTEQQTESSIQSARRNTEYVDYEAAVSEHLQDLLAEYNDRAIDSINNRLEQAKEALADYMESSIFLRFGGSVSKHTYVDGISDVDCLCFLNPSKFAAAKFAADSPQQLLKEFETLLRQIMGKSADVERGAISIKLKYKDGPELQILPALQTSTGVRIPAYEEDTWSQVVHPQRFAQALTDLNQKLSGKLVPAIKLIKPVMNSLEPKMKGYHIEALAERIFDNYQGELNSKAMVRHFLDRASELVKMPIRDITGQSVYVDDYLGQRNSPAREAIGISLQNITQRIDEADARRSVDDWLSSIDAK